MMAGTGVSFDVDIIERRVGSCPSRAPTKNNLDDVNIDPLTDPKQDKETNTGITHDTAPRTLSPHKTATAFDARNSLGERTVK